MPATLERDHVKAPRRPAAQPVREPLDERPVFASESRRRTRALRALGWSLAGLTAVWLAALVLGAFGLSPLPSVTPGATGSAPPADAVGTEAPRAAEREARRAATAREASRGSSGTAEERAAARRAAARRKAASDSSASEGTARTETESGPSTSPAPASGTGTTTPPATAAPTTTAPTTRGNSATAPGAANRPDSTTTDTAPGGSGTAPGQTKAGGSARGGRSGG